MDRRRVLQLGLASTATLALGTRGGYAQGKFPDHPVRLVVPFPPGGPYDVVGRMYAKKMSDFLGEPMVVENKPGGETTIGAAEVAHSRPDGYTVLYGGAPTHVYAPIIVPNVHYDPINDFIQLAISGLEPLCITVGSNFPAKTLPELTALAKANPGKYNYGDTAPSAQLAVELYKSHAGNPNIVGVPYKGFSPAVRDLLGGRIQVLPALLGSVTNYHRQGSIRILGVLSEKRIASVPDVPTAIESGYPDLVLWTFGLFCTVAGTPTPIVDTLYQATHKVLNDDEFIKFQQARGIETVSDSTRASASQFVRDQITRLGPMIKTLRKS